MAGRDDEDISATTTEATWLADETLVIDGPPEPVDDDGGDRREADESGSARLVGLATDLLAGAAETAMTARAAADLRRQRPGSSIRPGG